MKSTYFTPQNIQVKAAEMLAQIRQKNSTSPFHFQEAALLVLDMQDYFLNPAAHAYIPSAPAIIPHLQELIAAFARHHQPVIFTRHVNTAENAGGMARWWREMITDEDPHSAITTPLALHQHRILIKNQYDAFYQTELESILKSEGVKRIVITGVMTHLCCETTARSAFMRGFEVFFVVDGTATYNQAFHRASLLNLSHGFATLVLTAEITGNHRPDED